MKLRLVFDIEPLADTVDPLMFTQNVMQVIQYNGGQLAQVRDVKVIAFLLLDTMDPPHA